MGACRLLRSICADSIEYFTGGTWRDDVAPLPHIVTVVLVLLLISGSQPHYFTKWGIFRLICTPLHLGALWWVLREAPWSAGAVRARQRAAALATLQEPHRRRGGWTGLGYSPVLDVVVLPVAGMLGFVAG